MVEKYVHHYNHVRLHSAVGYVAPVVKLEGRKKAVYEERDRKLEEARERRRLNRQALKWDPDPGEVPATQQPRYASG